MAKAYHLPIDYVLHRMSYANIIMYSSVLPSYSSKSKEDSRAINADDPQNRSIINKILGP